MIPALSTSKPLVPLPLPHLPQWPSFSSKKRTSYLKAIMLLSGCSFPKSSHDWLLSHTFNLCSNVTSSEVPVLFNQPNPDLSLFPPPVVCFKVLITNCIYLKCLVYRLFPSLECKLPESGVCLEPLFCFYTQILTQSDR